jgi:hypothetical protein
MKKLLLLILFFFSLNFVPAQQKSDLQKSLSLLNEAEKLYEQKKYNEANTKLLQSIKLVKEESSKMHELRLKINQALADERLAKEEARRNAERAERKRNHDLKIKEGNLALQQNDFDLAMQKVEEAQEFMNFSSESNALRKKIISSKQVYDANIVLNQAYKKDAEGKSEEALDMFLEANQILKRNDIYEKIWELEQKIDKKNLFEKSLRYAQNDFNKKNYKGCIFWVGYAEALFPIKATEKALVKKSHFYLHFDNAVDLYNHRAYDMADSVLNIAKDFVYDNNAQQNVELYKSKIRDRKEYYSLVNEPRTAYKNREFKVATNLYEVLKNKYGLEPIDSLFYSVSKEKYFSQYEFYTASIDYHKNKIEHFRYRKNINKVFAWPTTLTGLAGTLTSIVLISEGAIDNEDDFITGGIVLGAFSLATTIVGIHLFDKGAQHKQKIRKHKNNIKNLESQRQNIAFYNRNIHNQKYYCIGLAYRF